jgi:hypothetical protein
MVRVEVPARVYEKAVRLMDDGHKSAWAVMDIVPGRSWRVHRDPWERIEAAWKAEDIMNAIRKALKARRAYA